RGHQFLLVNWEEEPSNRAATVRERPGSVALQTLPLRSRLCLETALVGVSCRAFLAPCLKGSKLNVEIRRRCLRQKAQKETSSVLLLNRTKRPKGRRSRVGSWVKRLAEPRPTK